MRCDRIGEPLEADFGDVLNARVQAFGSELFGVDIEVLVIEPLDDELIGELLQDRECERCSFAADGKGDAGLDGVVVAVAGGVVALPVQLSVFLIGQCGSMEAVRGGKLEPLSDTGVLAVIHGILQRERGCEAPRDRGDVGLELLGDGVGERREHRGRTRFGRAERGGDQGDRRLADRMVDRLNIDEVPRRGRRRPDAGHVEFVLRTKTIHRGMATGAVVRSERRRRIDVRPDGKANGSVELDYHV